MAVIEVNDIFAIVRLEVIPHEISGLLERHRKKYPGAEKCEELGRGLVKHGFLAEEAVAFVTEVCEWGRGHRLVPKILKSNEPKRIASTLREGYSLAIGGSAADGVELITELKYLGQSFGSKQLRFLAPDNVVILDEVIRTGLGYSATRAGYLEFLADCNSLLQNLRASNMVETNLRARLRLCDVEAAIFAKLQGY